MTQRNSRKNVTRRTNAQALLLAAAAGASFATANSASAQTWVANTTGNWSNSANWVAGAVPASSNATIVRFPGSGATSFTATQDIANPFTLNTLVAAHTGTGAVNIAGNQLRFETSPDPFAPQIANLGSGTLNIANPILIVNPSALTALFYTSGTLNTGQTNLTGQITGTSVPAAGVGAAVFNDSATSRLNLSGGANSIWGIVGNQGTTALTAGTYNIRNIRMAEDDDVTATMLITGNSTVVNGITLDNNFGANTTSFVTINNGAKVNLNNGFVFMANAQAELGDALTSFATMNIDGPGSSLAVTGDGSTNGALLMAFGGPGVPAAGTLNITNGGTMSTAIAFIGDSQGVGTVNISGTGSRYTNTGQFLMESTPASVMNITAGGQFVQSGPLFTASSATEAAAFNVSGANSVLNNGAGSFAVFSGGGGAGVAGGSTTLNISSGGQAIFNLLAAANNPNSRAAITVDGAGSRMTLQGAGALDDNTMFLADDAGTVGTLTVQNGAAFEMAPTSPTGGALLLAANSGSTGLAVATVTGPGSTMTGGPVGSQLWVGVSSNGTQLIDGGVATFNVLNNAVVDLRGTGTNNFAITGTRGVINVGAGTAPATFRTNELVVNNRVNYNSGTLSTGTLAVAGTVFLSDAARNAAGTPSNKKVLEAGTLELTGSGVIDLNDNDAIFKSTSYTTVANAIRTARNNGAWNGVGITSTAAKNASPQNRTLGTLRGDEWQAAQGASLFNGRTVAATDTLVKYTFNGDATFDGRITFDDYAKIDTGFNASRTGWFNGDFNYDGVVNFDDYALIDQAFLTQGSTVLSVGGEPAGPGDREIVLAGVNLGKDMTHNDLVAQLADLQAGRDGIVRDGVGSTGGGGALRAVPEPASLGLIGLAVGAMGVRRRRSR